MTVRRYKPGTKRIYIAGPMKGKEDRNFPVFHSAERWLRAQGWNTINPATKETLEGTDLPDESLIATMTLGEIFRADFTMLVNVDAIALLPGWEESTGAKAEFEAASLMDLERYFMFHCSDLQSCGDTWTMVPVPKGLALDSKIVDKEKRIYVD